MDELFIDVGMHRTATTFRQQEIYPKLKDVDFYPHCFINGSFQFIDFNKDRTIVLSDETLSGESYSPQANAVFQRRKTIKNLKKWFPTAKIIISIRNKKDWITSLYRHYIWEGGTYSRQKWMENIDSEVFEIGNYVNSLEKNFDEVLLLELEEMKNNIGDYVEKILQFTGTNCEEFTNKKAPSGQI